MRCSSCDAEIPPEFVNAIQTNCCPGCGGSIMQESDKALLDELTSAIDRMKDDIAGLGRNLAGWLMSNYIFEKIGDAKPVEKFHGKRSVKEDDGIDRENLKIAESPTEEFLKRTDSYNQVKRTQANLKKMSKGSSKIAEMARAIQSVEDPYGTEENPHKETEAEEVAAINQEDLAAYKDLLRMGGNPFVEVDPAAIARPALNADELNDEERGQPTAIELELAKSEKGRQVLQDQRLKRIKAQDALNGGGMIRRG